MARAPKLTALDRDAIENRLLERLRLEVEDGERGELFAAATRVGTLLLRNKRPELRMCLMVLRKPIFDELRIAPPLLEGLFDLRPEPRGSRLRKAHRPLKPLGQRRARQVRGADVRAAESAFAVVDVRLRMQTRRLDVTRKTNTQP